MAADAPKHMNEVSMRRGWSGQRDDARGAQAHLRGGSPKYECKFNAF
jgi:hypothetical protein